MTTKKTPAAPDGPGEASACEVRLPVRAEALAPLGLDPSTWRVLVEMTFPTARTAEAVLMAVRYCRARNLDPLKRPVHVVPMWSTTLRREVETVWPGIAEVQTTAARTGQWAGMDSPRFGPELTRTFAGRRKREEAWEEVAVTVTFPEWCEITVYRLVGGVRCPFSEPVFWLETYARAGGARSEVPNDMWLKRPRGQLVKCAKAASLRAAFPEEAGDYTAEEMEGRVIEAGGVPVPGEPALIETPPASEPEREPAIEAEVRQQVARLVARTLAAGAWAQAEAYCRARFNGPDLEYALAELARAQAAREDRAA
jgi:phage recombination protein Bet